MSEAMHERVADFITRKLSAMTELPPDAIDPEADLACYGMDSLLAAMLTEELNIFLRQDVIDLNDMATISTINDVAALVAGRFRE